MTDLQYKQTKKKLNCIENFVFFFFSKGFAGSNCELVGKIKLDESFIF